MDFLVNLLNWVISLVIELATIIREVIVEVVNVVTHVTEVMFIVNGVEVVFNVVKVVEVIKVVKDNLEFHLLNNQ